MYTVGITGTAMFIVSYCPCCIYMLFLGENKRYVIIYLLKLHADTQRGESALKIPVVHKWKRSPKPP